MGDSDFWEWFISLDPYTREFVLFDIAKETQEKGRELTEEELNEIRAKYEPQNAEEAQTDGHETDEQEADGETDGQEADGQKTETY